MISKRSQVILFPPEPPRRCFPSVSRSGWGSPKPFNIPVVRTQYQLKVNVVRQFQLLVIK